MSRIVAIVGGDEYDTSCDHVVVPDGMDLEAEKEAYARWLPGRPRGSWKNFDAWLIERGAREAGPDDVEILADP